MYWNLKKKKKSLPNVWRAQNGHFFHIWKNCKKRFFLPSPLLPWNLPMNFHQKVVFLHLESMPFKIKQRKRGGFRVKSWPNVASKQLQSRKKYNKNIETLLAKRIFFLPYLRQAAKIYVSTSYSVVRQETIEISEQRTAFVWSFAQEVDWCMINCDKQRLQTSVSINLWKILAGHTGDWFDVKTASICTTELWDALKSFILTSLKFKVAPYPIIVSLDTLKGHLRALPTEIISPAKWRSNRKWRPTNGPVDRLATKFPKISSFWWVLQWAAATTGPGNMSLSSFSPQHGNLWHQFVLVFFVFSEVDGWLAAKVDQYPAYGGLWYFAERGKLLP